MTMKPGVIKKSVKRYPLAWKRGGWSVDIMECGHAFLVGAGAKNSHSHVCSICQKESERAKPKAKALAVRGISELLKHHTADEILAALVKRESFSRKMSEAGKRRWANKSQKKVEPISPEAEMENIGT